jgi:hypothetical protein
MTSLFFIICFIPGIVILVIGLVKIALNWNSISRRPARPQDIMEVEKRDTKNNNQVSLARLEPLLLADIDLLQLDATDSINSIQFNNRELREDLEIENKV